MSTINVRIAEGIAELELNRPHVRNAINVEMVREMGAALESLLQRDELRAVVLSGIDGKAFASGADVAEMRERTHREAFFAINASLFQKLEDFPRPTIAAIEGYALGGGLELALACDLRVGSRSARVGLPEATLGIYPAAGGTFRLPRLIGLGRAKDLIFTGRILEAEEAYALGIFERLCEPGHAVQTAKELGRNIAGNAPLAVQVAKAALNSAARGGDPIGVERLGQALLFDSPEKRERMTAFLEKRTKSRK
ncbi:MAG TPA: enoyl-CoA hydratase/isomerase family protein [Myxococcaceae bacterium]|nr:enoyl-CoA hydratase/isomerase family protein [Myxococcaceae bacterium]